MILRRYYPKGFKGKTYTEEYLKRLQDWGVNTDIIDNARFEMLLDASEQKAMYDQCVSMVLNNTRWVLDNLDKLTEFKVSWETYWRPKKPKDL